MANSRRTLVAVIPARQHSRRLPGKNRAVVGGVPLVERAVRHARSVGAELIVVTTDDPQIAQQSKALGDVTVVDRPADLATSTATSDDVLSHALEAVGPPERSSVLLLQPTSPFRSRATLRNCLDLHGCQPDALVVTVVAATKQPSWVYRRASDGRLRGLDVDDALVYPTGAVYLCGTGQFMSARRLTQLPRLGVMVDGSEVVDIDERHELITAQAWAQAGLGDDIVDAPSTTQREARCEG